MPETPTHIDHALERAIAAEEALRRLGFILSCHFPSMHTDLAALFTEYERVITQIESES